MMVPGRQWMRRRGLRSRLADRCGGARLGGSAACVWLAPSLSSSLALRNRGAKLRLDPARYCGTRRREIRQMNQAGETKTEPKSSPAVAPEHLRWDTAELQSHRCTVATASVTREEIILNFCAKLGRDYQGGEMTVEL